MSASATLSVKITGDASSFEKAVNKAQQTCSNLQTRLGGHNGTGRNGAIQRIYTLESD